MRKLLIPVLLLTASAALADDPPGAAIYLKKGACATCHSKDGSGSTPTGKALQTPDLRSEAVQKKSDRDLATTISEGRNKMPGYKASLSAEEIGSLVGYIRALAK